ncbi:MAG: hypothetical protein WKG32_20090 [Gemmatimonadaceae bacterium]
MTTVGRAPAPQGDDEGTLARAAHGLAHAAEIAFLLPSTPRSRWHRAGVSRRGELVFDVGSGLVLAVFAIGWIWSVAMARSSGDSDVSALAQVTATVAAALTEPDAPTASYVTEAAIGLLTPLRGASGKLRAQIGPAGAGLGAAHSLPAGVAVEYVPGGAVARADTPATAAATPRGAGVWTLALRAGEAIRRVEDFSVITLRPLSDKRRGKIGLYFIGNWPTERKPSAKGTKYAPPTGFIEVTPENQDTYVSEHFRLRDFLTHDQQGVWPKYLVLDTKLVDKLELVLTDLSEHGVNTAGVRVMSGFRTPQYNVGGGDPRGRASLSRHMYGDASDIYIDNDGDGHMDDLDRDGRVTVRDARVIEAAVDRVERAQASLVGGCGVYVGNPAHGPFVHIDTRGYRARWLGTGDS